MTEPAPPGAGAGDARPSAPPGAGGGDARPSAPPGAGGGDARRSAPPGAGAGDARRSAPPGAGAGDARPSAAAGAGARDAWSPAPPALDAAALKLWLQKWRWYERNSLPWNRARIHWEFMRRRAFVRWPVHGNVLEALREGRLEIGAHVLLEPGVWLTAPGEARIRIGPGTFLNLGVMVASLELVEIGEHCMLANGCYVTDSSHRFDDPDAPVPWQGFTSKGPTKIGDNVWCGVNVVVTTGVTIGDRCVIGANSVVTSDIPPCSIAAGAPARIIRTITYE